MICTLFAGVSAANLASSPMKAARSRRIALIACLLGLAFTAFYAGTSRGTFVFGDDILMYQVTQAIWDRGEVTVTSPSRRGDVAKAVLGRDRQRFAKYGLGPSLVALPFYGASHELFDRLELTPFVDGFGNERTGTTVFGTGLTNAALGGATVAVTFLLAVELGFPLLVALMTAICLGSATLLAHYSSTFLSEPLSALCLAGAVLGLLKVGKKDSVKGEWPDRWWLAVSGFAAGLAVATKVAHIVLVVPILVWAAVLGWRRERARGLAVHTLYWSFFFSCWLCVVAGYNWVRFGRVISTGYGGEAGMFSTAPEVGLAGLLASPARGVFWYCPVLFLAAAGALAFWRRHRACALTILTASAGWLLLISRYYQWYGGGCWGPRFLVPLLPLSILPAAEIFARWRRGRGWQTAIVLVVGASLVTTAAALLVPFDGVGQPLSASQAEFEARAWTVAESPLLRSLAYVPEGVVVTAAKLSGRMAIRDEKAANSSLQFPDFAFVRYGSHALLNWTRGSFLLAALALAVAIGLAKGAGGSAQKALLSSPPQ